MEEKIRNLTFIVIFGFIIMFILIIGLYFKDGGSSNNSSNNGSSSSSSGSSSTSNYDVSQMNEVDVDDALALFDEEGTHVLYIGRSTCSVCVQFVPVLNEVQEDLDFKTNYLDVDAISSIWAKNKTDAAEEMYNQVKRLTDKLDIEASANGETDTLGNLFISKGFTPALVVIKDGKVVEGFFGYRDKDTLTGILEEYL